MNSSVLNALTVDVEDAVNQAMRNFFNMDMEPTSRVWDNTSRLLDLFDEYNVKATFFILGEVAATFPDLVKKIAGRSHELGIHGYSHTRYTELAREEVRGEIKRAKCLVEDIIGAEVIGHRAPAFSINQNNKWVLEILSEEGIRYDSSIFPINSGRYGWQGFNREIVIIGLDNDKEIIEAPLATVKSFGKLFPACGGGYLRALPYQYTDYAFRKIMHQRPVNVYLHPYELDIPPFQEFYMNEVRKSSMMNKLQLKAYWYNRSSVIPKLRRLLGNYRFTTLKDVINNALDISL